MHINCYFSASNQNSDTAITSGRHTAVETTQQVAQVTSNVNKTIINISQILLPFHNTFIHAEKYELQQCVSCCAVTGYDRVM